MKKINYKERCEKLEQCIQELVVQHVCLKMKIDVLESKLSRVPKIVQRIWRIHK